MRNKYYLLLNDGRQQFVQHATFARMLRKPFIQCKVANGFIEFLAKQMEGNVRLVGKIFGQIVRAFSLVEFFLQKNGILKNLKIN